MSKNGKTHLKNLVFAGRLLKYVCPILDVKGNSNSDGLLHL